MGEWNGIVDCLLALNSYKYSVMYTNKHPNHLNPKHMLTKTLMIDYISTLFFKNIRPLGRRQIHLLLPHSLPQPREEKGNVQMGSDLVFKSSLKSVNTDYERSP